MTTYGPNIWNPPRIASCTCGEHHFGTLAEINRWFAVHEVEGTEGVDHAIYIELDRRAR